MQFDMWMKTESRLRLSDITVLYHGQAMNRAVHLSALVSIVIYSLLCPVR